jgi:dTDP-4-amino-4,6-dideoxygalactose transaminase
MMSMHVPFLDLRVTDSGERSALLAAMGRVLDHGRLLNGPEVETLEGQLADRCQRKFGVGVGSGTDAVFLGLKALGVCPGDEVITTPLSFVATANAIAMTGAQPVFADIGEDLNIDPSEIEKVLTDKTKAIVPVHWAGKLADMPAIMDIARNHELLVLEDSAQGFGATDGDSLSCSFGDVAAFSMNSMKGLASLGEAGMVLSDREDIRDRLISLRYNGMLDKEICTEPSHNSRLDTLQAAVLIERLARYDDLLVRRRANAAFYDEAIGDLVRVPDNAGGGHVYYTYTIRSDQRDALKDHLEANGVEVKVQHPVLMPEQPAHGQGVNVHGRWQNAKRLTGEVLCLPIHEDLGAEARSHVADMVRSFFGGSRNV